MKKIYNNTYKALILDVLFPNRCPFCDEIIMWNELCCGGCLRKLTDANDIICRRCGKTECCCGKSEPAFDAVYASFFYDEVQSAVYGYKHEGMDNFGELAAADIAERVSAEGVSAPDMIVPVPMGRKKQRKRGHNQAELFGKSIGKRLDIPVRNGILFKYDTKDEQHFHTEKERLERVRTIFYGGNADISGKTVLLCDDVMTTGATLNRCAELLKSMGAEKVIAAVCAVTRLNTDEKDA